MNDIAVLDAQASVTPPHAAASWGRHVDLVDVYDLPRTDLYGYRGLVIEGMVDQEFLYRERHVIQAFLDDGGVVVFSGHLLRPWLPGCGLFVPKQVRSYRDYAISLVTSHPVFEGVDPHDLTFRRGVAGFFARGHHPPPPGAQVVLALAGGEPVVYLDRCTTPGTILAHAGGGLLGWAEPGSSAARITPQLLAWMREAGREGRR